MKPYLHVELCDGLAVRGNESDERGSLPRKLHSVMRQDLVSEVGELFLERVWVGDSYPVFETRSPHANKWIGVVRRVICDFDSRHDASCMRPNV